jgi:two-component system, LytTR family, sensor kinase
MGPFINHFVFSRSWRYRLARHAFFWLAYFGVFQVMDLEDQGLRRTIAVALCYLPFNMLFVYLVLYRLVPRLLMQSAYWSFFVWYCGCGLACLTLDYFWGYLVIYRSRLVHSHVPPPDFWHTVTHILDPANFTVMNSMAVLGVGIVLYKFWRQEVWQKLQLKQEKTKAELELLKAQLHPHFLFNTLNNLYALVIERSDKAPQMLMRLSAILSYVLYECRGAEVPLEREIGICNDYIELERERYGDRLDVSLDLSGPTAGKLIAPMLFQPFIEHAFQQELSDQGGKLWMSIEMSVRHDQFFFRLINSMDPDDRLSQPRSQDAGIDNAIRRLELLYPGAHQLSREKGEGVFIVSLTIDLPPAVPVHPGTAGLKNQPVFI